MYLIGNGEAINRFFLITVLFSSLLGCTTVQEHGEILKTKISRGDCQDANNYAKQNFSNGDLYIALATVSYDCKRDKKAAIEFLKVGAREGYRGPIEQLIEMGITPPEPTKRVVIQQSVQPQFQPPPQPVQPQIIIIDQQPQQRNTFDVSKPFRVP